MMVGTSVILIISNVTLPFRNDLEGLIYQTVSYRCTSTHLAR